jgi:protein subunit release factor A
MSIDPDDLRIEVIYEQTGTTERPSGQHAGMPATAVRVKHIPTGVVAQVGLSRSLHKNKATAIEMIEWALGVGL